MTATGWPRCGHCAAPARTTIRAGHTAAKADHLTTACDRHHDQAAHDARHFAYRESRAAQPGDVTTAGAVEQDALFDLNDRSPQ